MPTATPTSQTAMVNAAWEPPVGQATATARIDPLPFIYVGADEPHWANQPCGPVSPDADFDADARVCRVTFACGCRGVVDGRMLVCAASALQTSRS